MPIDPQIPLMVRPAAPIDPMSALAQVMQLKQLQQQGEAQAQQAKLRDQQLQAGQLEIAAKQRTQAGQAALAAAIKDPSNRTPDGAVNHEQIASKLSESFPDVAEAWLAQTSKNAEALDKLASTKRAHAEAAQEAIGSLAASASNEREFEASLGLLASQGVLDEATATKVAQQASEAGPEGWKAIRDQYVHLAPSARKAAMTADAKLHEPRDLAPGHSFGVPGQLPVMTAPDKKAYQSKAVLLDGKPAELNFDPETGAYSQGGQAIDPSRVKPVPAAALTIRNMNAQAPNMPAWALDDSRPTGPDANKMDQSVRFTPNGLHQAALNYIATGQFPPTGRGSDPVAVAQRAAIESKVGAIAATSGMDVPALRAFYKANSASLAQQQKMADSVQGFMATADKNADKLAETLKKIPDSWIPLLNKPLRTIDQKVFGDVTMAAFKTYLQSVQNEYARIIAQPNLAGQLTDSARQEAETLLDPNATVKQQLASIEALKTEGANRLVSIGEQIQRIQKRMTVTPPATPPPAAPPATPITVGKYQVVVRP